MPPDATEDGVDVLEVDIQFSQSADCARIEVLDSSPPEVLTVVAMVCSVVVVEVHLVSRVQDATVSGLTAMVSAKAL